MKSIVLLLLLSASSLSALPAYVQSKSIASASVTSNAVTLTSATTNHNTLLGFVRMSGTTSSATLAGTSGETWTLITSQVQTSNSHTIAAYYAKNIPGGSDTVTATYNASNAHAFLAVYEISGVSLTDPLDQFTSVSSGATTSTSASVGPTSTTTIADEFVFAGFGQPSTTTDTPTAGTGYTLGEKNTTNVADSATEYKVVSSTGTQTAGMTYSAAIEYSGIIVTFKAPPAVSITTSSLPGGSTGTSYSQTLATSGGTSPFSWSVTVGSLPASLSLGSSTGVISGTPSATGTSSFTVQVTDANLQTATQALSIAITASSSIALVQSAVNTTGNNGTTSSFASTPTVGNVVVMFCGMFKSGMTGTDYVTVNDNYGNPYRILSNYFDSTNGTTQALAIAKIGASGAGFVATCTDSLGATTVAIAYAAEYSGLSLGVDQVFAQNYSAGASNSCSSLTTATSDEAELFFVVSQSGGATWAMTTLPTGFTQEQSNGHANPGFGSSFMDRLVSTTGTTSTLTFANNDASVGGNCTAVSLKATTQYTQQFSGSLNNPVTF